MERGNEELSRLNYRVRVRARETRRAPPRPTVAECAVAIGVAADGRARIAAVDERVRERCEHLGDLDLAWQDVLIEVTRALQKELWMVRSQL